MTKDEDFKFLKIQTCVLKVNIHCDGCKQEVKKLLQRIEGVYTVNIDAEQQKVTVSGSVDSGTLIKKLVKYGKHAELWSAKSNQNQKQQLQQSRGAKDNKNNKDQKQGAIKGFQAFKNQPKFPTFSPEEDEFDCSDDDEDEDEDDLQFLRDKMGHLAMLRQQANEANSAKKGGAGAVHIPASSNGKVNNAGNGSASKKGGAGGVGNFNQNMGLKAASIGIDQRNMAATKMGNAHLGGGNINSGKANDINPMLNLAGFHGHGADGGGLGGNGVGIQAQTNNRFQGSSAGFPAAAGGFAAGGHQPPPMMMPTMQGYQHPSSSVMNLQNRHNVNNMMMMNDTRYMQPQMMYYRSPIIPPNTGYYYNYNYNSAPYPSVYPENRADHSAAYMFSDENTNGCSIM
ncbi:PREDICTED: heavy metal-associated isoprenylated plant protein 3-like [Nelumbo nucifera]|uniref:Heavy metal-associated isoprenylated plant protein 3-like n=2 Tax=Nelumbo nucifera TaxID=4432 RepID=A0A1U7ZZV5_NELNU|nr:PREDICTED: heavy metal-associated isoprenylated plant protein 3-like [Nelumbo nucifera]DAD35636.1 TPA_asm: hypothetical protein HUJ06_006276 [Nelumbo nucifera]